MWWINFRGKKSLNGNSIFFSIGFATRTNGHSRSLYQVGRRLQTWYHFHYCTEETSHEARIVIFIFLIELMMKETIFVIKWFLRSGYSAPIRKNNLVNRVTFQPARRSTWVSHIRPNSISICAAIKEFKYVYAFILCLKWKKNSTLSQLTYSYLWIYGALPKW